MVTEHVRGVPLLAFIFPFAKGNGTGSKATLPRMNFPPIPTTTRSFMPRTNRDYEKEVGDASLSSIIEAVVGWVTRNFPEAPVTVQERNADDKWESIMDHPLSQVIEHPNKFYSGIQLWAATLSDWMLTGNSYWLKVRSQTGLPVELWWVPQQLVEPVGTASEYITHYEYRPDPSQPQKVVLLDPDMVVHFRGRLDPTGRRKGQSPLRSLWRELFTDEEASNFAASVLANLGIPGVILSPKLLPEDEYGSDNEIDGDAVKREFKNRFGGDNRGEPLVMMGPTDVNVLSWSPQQLDLAMNRRIPEERVTAVLGIHPMVVGLGAGLARSTFSNYGEARAAAYENTIIPWQRLFSAEIASQLLGDFETDSMLRFRVMFDLSEVRALADDQDALWRNADIGVKGGWAQVAEARQLVGLPVDDSHRIYLRNFSTVEVPSDGPSPLAALPNEEDPNPDPEDDDDSEGDEDDDDDDDSDVEERALKAYSPVSYVEAVTQATLPLMDPYADSLEEVFNTIGQDVADAYLRVEGLKAEEEEIDALVGRVMNAVAVNARFRELATELTTAHYTRVAEIVFQITGEQLGISMAFNLDDPVGIRVLEEGGKRMGLVDITEDTRRALFRTFADARELGEGPYDVARRIRQNVPAGRFTKAGARYRSVLIARTETKYAQNFSSLEAAKATEMVTHMLAFDAQLGNSDPDCEERDGMQFTIREAEEAMRNEHPNGTLNFAPITN